LANKSTDPPIANSLQKLLNHSALYSSLVKKQDNTASSIYRALLTDETETEQSIAYFAQRGNGRARGPSEFPVTLQLLREFALRAGYENFLLYSIMRDTIRLLILKHSENSADPDLCGLIDALRSSHRLIREFPRAFMPDGSFHPSSSLASFDLETVLQLPVGFFTEGDVRFSLSNAEAVSMSETQQIAKVHDFISPKWADELSKQADLMTFGYTVHSKVDLYDYAITTGPVVPMLEDLLNQPCVLRKVEEWCGLKPRRLSRFVGRLYMLGEECGTEDWHSDCLEPYARLLGFSLDLSPKPYAGGELTLRNKKDKSPCGRAKAEHRGEALLFRIDPNLQHRVLPIEGGDPRIAFVGWFIAEGRTDPMENPAEEKA
jgi:hypothetical protein